MWSALSAGFGFDRVVDFALGGHSVDDVAQHEAGDDTQNLQKKIRFKLKEWR